MSPFLVGELIEIFAFEAPYQEPIAASITYDPTYPMVLVIGSCYLISSVGFAIAAILLQMRTRKIALSRQNTR